MNKTYISNDIATATLLYTTHETSAGSEFAILHAVRLGWHNSTLYPLNDSQDRMHFEQLLTQKTGLDCYATESDAEADLANWHEDYIGAMA